MAFLGGSVLSGMPARSRPGRAAVGSRGAAQAQGSAQTSLPEQRSLTQTRRNPQSTSLVQVVTLSQVKTPRPAHTFWLRWAASARRAQEQPPKQAIPTVEQLRPQSPFAQKAPPGQREE